jgi:copper(I)-binding protein
MKQPAARSWPAAAIVAGTMVVAGCGASSSGASAAGPIPALSMTGGHSTLGDLTVTRAYIPDPASPSTAAAYFTVANSGSTPDRLVSVTSSGFASSTVHHYLKTADGAEEMVPLTGGAVIPAHGRLVLQPGADHVMLMRPVRALRQGATAALTLVFAKAGRVTVRVPVVADTGLPSAGSMAGMHM